MHRIILIAAALASSHAAQAGSFVDMSPERLEAAGFPYFSSFVNVHYPQHQFGQSFMVGFTVGAERTFSSIDIYSDYPSWTEVGNSPAFFTGRDVLVQIRRDAGTLPSTETHWSQLITIAAVDREGAGATPRSWRYHIDFDDVTLAPGRWWIGVVGWSTPGIIGYNGDIGWADYGRGRVPAFTPQAASGNLTNYMRYHQGYLAYRLQSTTSGTAAVPEPATWAMMIAGFGMVGAALRRRSAVAA